MSGIASSDSLVETYCDCEEKSCSNRTSKKKEPTHFLAPCVSSSDTCLISCCPSNANRLVCQSHQPKHKSKLIKHNTLIKSSECNIDDFEHKCFRRSEQYKECLCYGADRTIQSVTETTLFKRPASAHISDKADEDTSSRAKSNVACVCLLDCNCCSKDPSRHTASLALEKDKGKKLKGIHIEKPCATIIKCEKLPCTASSGQHRKVVPSKDQKKKQPRERSCCFVDNAPIDYALETDRLTRFKKLEKTIDNFLKPTIANISGSADKHVACSKQCECRHNCGELCYTCKVHQKHSSTPLKAELVKCRRHPDRSYCSCDKMTAEVCMMQNIKEENSLSDSSSTETCTPISESIGPIKTADYAHHFCKCGRLPQNGLFPSESPAALGLEKQKKNKYEQAGEVTSKKENTKGWKSAQIRNIALHSPSTEELNRLMKKKNHFNEARMYFESGSTNKISAMPEENEWLKSESPVNIKSKLDVRSNPFIHTVSYCECSAEIKEGEQCSVENFQELAPKVNKLTE